MAGTELESRDRLRCVIIGAGMAGLLAGIRLKEKGDQFVIYEKGDKVGGTWRENRYPGLTCDVPAHAYTYSFAPNPEWSQFYAPGPEIQHYFERIADDYGIREHIRFGTEVAACRYFGGLWHITLSDGSTDVADVVIAATGVLHHPRTPDIPGLNSFAGDCFHSTRWDDTVPLDGRRIGVIGNGSTGVQIVSALSERASRLVHFQRSPQWIMPVQNFIYSETDRHAFRSDVSNIDAIRFGQDYWGGIRRFNAAIIDADSPEMAEIEAIVLRNLEESVTDPELREKLRPSYRAACKRLIYSPNYYAAVQRPNVFIETGPIERVEPEGVRMRDGTLHALDLLVLATGFHADRFVRPMIMTGRDGADLNQAWAVRPTAYYAITIPDFPNLFLLNGPTAPVGNFSLIDIAERQWAYIDQLLDLLRQGQCSAVAARHDALADYEERRITAARHTIFGSGCTSWYLDAHGVPLTWPWSYDRFAEAMAAPKLSDFELA
ncbi:flavin-containing monooxygenase [Sphingobium sp. EP60837]|uniref:flavin-containing monooxygenase n=1 Tax=Sphingobium sp. EP60837 TaxID=1855519 RepID=UPI0007DD50DF|nr:NAD(P)/FAD-dependent oxidoreductase [Sphingobium sp. EP60837]ANI79350.1 4-hydroxyacetophenone monooxygenase [Sphingobium sp. EP60837]